MLFKDNIDKVDLSRQTVRLPCLKAQLIEPCGLLLARIGYFHTRLRYPFLIRELNLQQARKNNSVLLPTSTMVGLSGSRWASKDQQINVSANKSTAAEARLEELLNEQNEQKNSPVPRGILNPQAETFSCSRREGGEQIPITFDEWAVQNSPESMFGGRLPSEEGLDGDIMKYMKYLLWEHFPVRYGVAFSNHIANKHAEELANFDYQTTHPSMGFLSFKEWAWRTRLWYKRSQFPELDDYQLYRAMVIQYEQGPLQQSAVDYSNFKKLREHRATFTRINLEYDAHWSSLGV